MHSVVLLYSDTSESTVLCNKCGNENTMVDSSNYNSNTRTIIYTYDIVHTYVCI